MIIEATGNILDSPAEAIVIPCNCAGVAGAGLALAAKNRFPSPREEYVEWCKSGKAIPGEAFVCQEYPCNEGMWVIWLATKDHWRNPSRIEWVRYGLLALRDEVNDYGWDSIAIPALGCGLGGLRWADVRPLIEAAFADWPGTVHLYAPGSERG